MTNTLLIFVKNPVLGKVKTRIAATAGNKRALAIYQLLVQHTRQITLPLPCNKWVFYDSFIPIQDAWPYPRYQKHLQNGVNLGQRMHNAFANAFAHHCSKVVIIGSDCLQLHTQHLLTAFEQLADADVVIGPATDGGYYLLGMKQLYAPLFENKPWSNSNLLAETLQNIQQLGLSYFLLPTLSDIDTWEDWLRCGGTEL